MLYAFPVGSIAFTAIVLGIDRLALEGPDMTVALGGKLTSTQLKSIEILTDLAKLVIAAAIGLLGFIVYYIKNEPKDSPSASSSQMVSMLFSTWFGLGSVYFGHRVISLVVEMLANDYYAITGSAVGRAVILQYVFLCCAVLFVILFVLLRHAPKSIPALPQLS